MVNKLKYIKEAVSLLENIKKGQKISSTALLVLRDKGYINFKKTGMGFGQGKIILTKKGIHGLKIGKSSLKR